MSSRVAALLLTCLATACAQPPTQVVVRLATDLETPTELDAIRLVLLDAEGEVVREQDLVDFSIPGDGAYHEIGSFGVVPRAADASRRFEVRAQARGAGRELFTTRARTGFVSEQTIRLDLYLPASCLTVAVTCQPDETCGVVGCVSPDVDPRGLPSHAEGAPL
ncbi:MAG: hypothetical protein H6719_37715, partial [Sandaracinaceae bacterium]|nr:hypothetical protein [Sandaracinaceae bacterium]